MATPQEKLAKALEALQELQQDNDVIIINADDLPAPHKKLLKDNGFIKEVIKGWYISTRPDEREGDTTSWYMSFWRFVSVYVNSRFGNDWCLSAEQSLLLHSGNTIIPTQLLVRSPKANNNIVQLLHGTSILDNKLKIVDEESRITKDGLQLYSLEDGLVAVGEDFFTRYATDARACLAMVKDGSFLLEKLLNGGHSVVSGRLAGALRNIGNKKLADNILKTMKSAGYDVRENDPFTEQFAIKLSTRDASPYANRMRLMWHNMREVVVSNFPAPKELPSDIKAYLKEVEDNYVDDAYNSLSIEGYRVTSELIEKVKSGNWNPKDNEVDQEARNAMAARGYYQAFQLVKESIKSILEGENAGEVADDNHGDWYRELFAPSVTAGLLKAGDLAGYRSAQVYIKGSMHTPLNPDAVRDAMPVLFDLIREETHAGVRAVLGHFLFVFIHPYMDGNGRIGRFLFNVMLASGGYSWTVVPLAQRETYMAALEQASVHGDITYFAKFLGGLVQEGLK
ncbi:Fic family protein [Plebeiibacterium marinum]|uniref:Fic family protein n=1 Tax=Plebeiibacterium marinum TaxID=2992111 RepID=A0AAE3SLS4_9BACT|nr:Fic family protein [Plebeiobacterium marinum]MCW3807774.1 Fic family protein [Plebeiobacterium marinum]